MSMTLLGESFDIHCGGVDNIFPHHENEIAQSEAATGKRFVRIWCHSEHLRVGGEKMAKRLGNFATVPEVLEEGASPAALRYLLAARTHYRKRLDYSDELLADSTIAVQRLVDFQTRVEELHTVEEDGNQRDEAVLASVRLMRIGFDEAMDDDLNLPEAMGIVFSGLRDVNRVLDSGPVSAETQRTLQHLLADVDDVLGVLALVARDRQAQPDAEEQRWLDERAAARAARDFAPVRPSPRAARKPRHRGRGHAAGAALEADLAAPHLNRWTSSTGATRCWKRCARADPHARSWLRRAIRPEARLTEILEHAEARDILIEEVSRQRLDDIAHTEHHQGVAGYFHARAALTIHDLLDQTRAPALLVVLDGIQDPQNVGAIARSAEACGADGIVVPRHHAAPLTAAAVKASAGATEHLPMVTVPNLSQALEVIGNAGIWRVGLDADADDRYDSVDLAGSVAIVVGAEGAGMRRLTREHCDVLVSIPMMGHVASLNAGAAAAVLLFEVQRQRGFAPR